MRAWLVCVGACTSSVPPGGGNGDGTIDALDPRRPDAARVDALVGDAPADALPETTLSNTAILCPLMEQTAPALPAEANHWAATTLTPPRYPFVVTELRYQVGAGTAECDGSVPHKVMAFVSTTAKPPAMPPSSAQSIDVPAGADMHREIIVPLPMPVTLMGADKIVVAVQLAPTTDGTKAMCVRTCNEAEPMEDWWSGAAMAPFDWKDMIAEYNFTTQFVIRARGR